MRGFVIVCGAACIALGALGCGDDDGGPAPDAAVDAAADAHEPVCGDGLQEGAEACDGSDLDHQECGDLVAGTLGPLHCAADCTFDTSACYLPACGDGIIDLGEECDTAALGGATCVTRGYQGGALGCTSACAYDESACVDCAPDEILCGDHCANLESDPDHCGDCQTACDPDELCVAGGCVSRTAAWTPLGSGALDEGVGATAHDLVGAGATPVVAYVTAGMATQRVEVRSGTGASLPLLGTAPTAGAPMVSDAVALAAAGTTPWVLWSGSDGMGGPNVHVDRWTGAAWQEVGAPGWTSACGVHASVDLTLDGTQPHLTTFGAGGCGLGVDYATWTGSLWRTHTSPTGFPAQLTMNGNGRPALVVTDRPVVGVADLDPAQPASSVTVREWDSGAMAWSTLDASLDENVALGTDEDVALATDATGAIYAAWAESDGAATPTYDVYVKRWDPATQAFTLLGAGPVNPAPGAVHPSLAVIGDAVWVAYADTTGAAWQIRVRRFEWASGVWLAVGPTLNVSAAEDAVRPVIANVAGVPHVAFREGTAPSYSLYLVRFP